MFSAFFIQRPIFATVVSIVLVLAGLAAMRILPIEQFPDVLPPTVTVSARYPGASAETLQQTVAAPIEQQINGVEDMIYMTSSNSSNGDTNITVYFNIGTDPDQATINVNNRVQLANPQLPEEVRRQGVTVRKSSGTFLQIIAVESPDGRYDSTYLSNYVLLNVLDELKRQPGAGDVRIFGAKDYAMRIWLRPDRMAQLGVTTSDIRAAVEAQNSQYPIGRIGQEPALPGTSLNYNISAQGRLADPEEFEEIIVRATPEGATLRLRDVARVELGAQDYAFVGSFKGKPAVLIGVFLQPGANALELSNGVSVTMARLAERFPPGIVHTFARDNTEFVRISVQEVVKTLLEAMALVTAVVFLFLQSWRATLIPVIAVPISLIGTFAGLLALGYSINTLTLFAMVLAIGIVVDDAIVVIENVERNMAEKGLAPKEAARVAMAEVTSAVVAIVFVLCAVFLPVAFLGGVAGVLYRQFAVTISIAVALSGLVALTLSPALCAVFLKPGSHGRKGRFFSWFNARFERLTQGYVKGVGTALKRPVLSFLVYALMIGITIAMARKVPTGFVPNEDQGYFLSIMVLPDGASLQRTQAATARLEEIAAADPDIDSYTVFNGFDVLSGSYRSSSASMFVTFKHWEQRKRSATDILGDFQRKASGIREGVFLGFSPPGIIGISSTGGFDFYVQNRGAGGVQPLTGQTADLIAAAAKRPELSGVTTQFKTNVPQLTLELDRAKAQALGVTVPAVFDALSANFGTVYVNDFNRSGRTFRVQMQAEAEFRSAPGDIGEVFVRARNDAMIPLSALASVRFSAEPEIIERFNGFPAARVIGNPAPGYSSGDAIAAMEEVARTTLGADFSYAWSGQAFQEKEAAGAGDLAFVGALVMVFLILAAQYEQWSLPFAVLLIVPFGAFGALLAVAARGLTNDIYFQIGLVSLIGLASKNAILIVEFASDRVRHGMDVQSAAREAAQLRFRPILMTSLAFILGVVPLVLSSGAGAASRRSLGTGVFGGMIAATFLALFFVPLFFRMIEAPPFLRRRGAAAEAEGARAGSSGLITPDTTPFDSDAKNPGAPHGPGEEKRGA